MVSSIAHNMGFGSGIDTVALINDLANASRQPKIEALQTKVSTNQAKISLLGQLSSALDNFASSLADVVTEGSFRTQPTVSDSSMMTAKLSGEGNVGALSAKMTVHALAAGQTLYSASQASSTDPIGQGVMTLSVGGTDYDITIDSTNDSLKGLAAAINNSGSGVKASIVNDAGGVRLVMKGETGLDNAFTLSADSSADPNLASFTYDGTSGSMTLGQAAADAIVEVDGLTLSRSSNSIDDIIEGVELTLLKADPGKTVTLGAERQNSALKTTLADFVSVYNTVRSTLKTARTEFGAEYGLRQFEQKFAGLTTTRLTDHGSINKLSDVGVYTNRDGTIGIDNARLEKALTADADAVEALFHPPSGEGVDSAANPGISGVMDKLKTSMLDQDGTLDTVQDRLNATAKSFEEQLEKIENREAAYRERLEKQFSSMDARLSALKATQSYLDQQIKIWNGDNG